MSFNEGYVAERTQCQRCGLTFARSFSTCAVCGGTLAAGSPEEGGGWVVVAVAHQLAEGAILGNLLAGAGLPYLVQTRGVVQYPLPSSGLDLQLVLVPAHCLAEAQGLLDAGQRGELEVRCDEVEEEA
ncbi:MAG: hypothetical protein NZ869_06425 [Thermoanaerobaculum sp.]|nr:hypothetical protein [Thermoanaerobaculum sp.]MDW7967862.1 hypothetical protein [Thermoanaerobaculum sp.]